jgi:hypothetical protein
MGIGVGVCFGGNVALWTPLSMSGVVLWLRSDMGITLAGTKVSGWADQSGNGHDVAQATDGNRPEYNTAGPIPSLDFVGAHPDYLEITHGYRTGKAYTMALIATMGSANGYQMLVEEWDNAAGLIVSSGIPGKWEQEHSSVAEFTATTNVTTAKHAVLASHAGGASTVARVMADGTAYTGVIAAHANDPTGVSVGARHGGSWGSTMSLFEVMVLNRQMTAPEETMWKAYTMRRHGV